MVDFLRQPFIKAVNLNDLPPAAWRIVSGANEGGELATVYRAVPWLFRGVELRAQIVGSMPFSIWRGKTEVDGSGDYTNATGIMPDPVGLFALVEAALTVWGFAYLEQERNIVATKGLRYLLPTSIKPVLDHEAGLVAFERNLGNGQRVQLSPKDLCYFWKPDPFVEIGPPLSSPVKAAMAAAGVSMNVNKFAEAFFARGAVKTTLLTVAGAVAPQERERLESWWARVAQGVKNTFASKIVNADKVMPVVIGEGLSELSNQQLSTDLREQVSTALGIPHSVLFSNAANYATSTQDDLHLYNKTILPECRFIESVLNRQAFEPMGLRLQFRDDTLDMFQEDEHERSGSLTQLVSAGMPLDLGMEILGFDLTDAQWARLRAEIAERKRQAEMIQERMPTQDGQPARDEEEDEENAKTVPFDLAELRRWRDKTRKRGKPTGWEPVTLSPAVVAAVKAAQDVLADPLDAFRFVKAVEESRDDAEEELSDALSEFFALWLKRFTRAIMAGEEPPWAEFEAALTAVLLPAMVADMTEEVLRQTAAIGVGIEVGLVNQAALEWAREYTYALVRGLTDTTRGVVREAVNAFIGTPGMTRETWKRCCALV